MNDIPTEAMTTELNDIIVGCEADMLKNYPQVITAFKTCYNLPELDPVRHEISLCLIFGLYQAAITLTNHLLESMLKYGLTYHHAINNRPVNPAQSAAVVKQLVDWLGEGNRLYKDKELASNINQACKVGLITKSQKERLHKFRKEFRNAYSHADKNKTFGKITTPISSVRFKTTEPSVDITEQVRLADFLIGQGVFQVLHAQQTALPYFIEIDAVVRDVLMKLFPDVQNHGS